MPSDHREYVKRSELVAALRVSGAAGAGIAARDLCEFLADRLESSPGETASPGEKEDVWGVPTACRRTVNTTYLHAAAVHGVDEVCPLSGHRAGCAATIPGGGDCDRNCAPPSSPSEPVPCRCGAVAGISRKKDGTRIECSDPHVNSVYVPMVYANDYEAAIRGWNAMMQPSAPEREEKWLKYAEAVDAYLLHRSQVRCVQGEECSFVLTIRRADPRKETT